MRGAPLSFGVQMRYRDASFCPMQTDAEAVSELETLQAALNCASIQGCDQCVPCSERALDLFRKVARKHTGRG